VSDEVPTLCEWAGGSDAFERLTEAFYAKVRQDPLLEPSSAAWIGTTRSTWGA
jgi:hemoglobin